MRADAAAPVAVVIPHDNVNDESVLVTRWYVDEGAFVTLGAPLLDVETSKANVTIDAPASGPVRQLCSVGHECAVGGTVAWVGAGEPASNGQSVDAEKRPETNTVFSEAAMAEIRRHNVDPAAFAERDFVRAVDVRGFVSGVSEKPLDRQPPPSGVAGERIPGSFKRATPTKRAEIRALTRVQASVVPSVLFKSVSTQRALVSLRSHLPVLRDSILPIVAYETSRLLLQFPLLNAVYQENGAYMYDEVALGIAFDLGWGLRVVTLTPSQVSSIREVEAALLDISELYENDRLSPEQLRGATFTITDLSGEGIDTFVPVVNAENAAILGIGASTPSGLQTLSLTFDHRVTEGRTAAKFLDTLASHVESFSAVAGGDGRSDAPERCARCNRSLQEDLALGGLGLFSVVGEGGRTIPICSLCTRGF